MRFSAFFLCLFFLLQSPTPCAGKSREPQKQQPQSINQPTNQNQRGTQDSPVFVKVIPSPKTQAEIDQDAEERQQQSSRQWWAIVISAVLAVIALGQAIIYWYQAIQLRRTVDSAADQSKAMNRHIGEAARSANAMEDISVKIRDGNKAILRAYLVVNVGIALFQERRGAGQPDLRFEARPNLLNTGNTPAHKVKIRIVADILPFPIPENFDYPLPPADANSKNAGTVGAHQTYTLYAMVDRFVPDAEVGPIKEGSGQALATWGQITYEDIFAESHVTNFALYMQWNPNGSLMGYFVIGHNDAN
ncbi:MAG TPA: hypothetical protein VHV29_11975 [Terriglobales bacterium]|jgi:hypothetical protein|nr:hypothetical protein [Terriglobales bacterium]